MWERVYAPNPAPVPTQPIDQLRFASDGAIYARHLGDTWRPVSGLPWDQARFDRRDGRLYAVCYDGPQLFPLTTAGAHRTKVVKTMP